MRNHVVARRRLEINVRFHDSVYQLAGASGSERTNAAFVRHDARHFEHLTHE
jgi:hypothetical protein